MTALALFIVVIAGALFGAATFFITKHHADAVMIFAVPIALLFVVGLFVGAVLLDWAVR